MKTKLRLKMRLKLYQNGKLALDTTRHKKSQLVLQLRRVSHDSSYIYVEYTKGRWNDSAHQSDDSLMKALTNYTEKSLVDFVLQKGSTR